MASTAASAAAAAAAAAAATATYQYVRSCDINLQITTKIGNLEGKRPRQSYRDLVDDPALRFSGLYQQPSASSSTDVVLSDVYVECQVFGDGKPLSLPIQTPYRPFSAEWKWDEWLTIPVTYRDLPRSAKLVFTIWDIYGPRKRVPLGGSSIDLFSGDGTLQWGECSLRVWQYVKGDGQGDRTPARLHDTLNTLEQLAKDYATDELTRIEWLDRLTSRKIDTLKEREKQSVDGLILTVVFPRFDIPVVYCERGGELPQLNTRGLASLRPAAPVSASAPIFSALLDPEVFLTENLVENKYHKQLRSRRRGPIDRDLKPNPAARDHLTRIMRKSPIDSITPEEKDLLWKYRFYLTREGKALTKFLRCVDWTDSIEEKQATELIAQWADIDVDDALELLTKDFKNKSVRSFAVKRLEMADDEELLLYLLQLVQALKYEFTGDEQTMEPPSVPEPDARDKDAQPQQPQQPGGDEDIPLPGGGDSSLQAESNTLEGFLIKRSLVNQKLCVYLFWYLMVECKDKEKEISQVYTRVWSRFWHALETTSESTKALKVLLGRQRDLLAGLRNLSKDLKQSGLDREKRIQKLKTILAEHEDLRRFEPLPLPLDPDVSVTGIVPETAHVFKSAMMPMGLKFTTNVGGEYGIIFKNGDDLRQDQLVLQVITLMDRLLKKENLDLKLTPYHCLATSATHGMVQLIKSTALADVLSKHGNIQNYFKHLNKSKDGINKDVMDNYIKSCAGYCVITYLLGVGDRHLDNLLITEDGHLFHIDFGYILGRDPKPYPPPMKITKEMIEGMGGSQSEETKRFRSYCFNCFLILRKNANLVLNLFNLMVDSNVQDIALDRDKTIMKIQEKFRLDLNDEQAVQFFEGLINDSINALFARITEAVHRWAQYWRK